MTRVTVLWLVAACASQPARPPQNVASAATRQIAIAPDQNLGWIAIAPRRTLDPDDWIPAGPQAVIVPLPAEGLAAGTTLSAIDTTGKVARVTVGLPQKLTYGCEHQQLDVLAFTNASSTPGPVWLLPATAPASWHPRSLRIVSPIAATAARRRDTVGPLELTLETDRGDATRGTLAIARDARVLHTSEISRGPMDGAPPDPLDLEHPGVGIPAPVAAWSFGEGGPILLVLQVPSYEGVRLTPIVVEPEGARELPAMALYLYRCAF